MNPIFSVCITSHNMALYIERAIESVLFQKINFEIEILICDDFSLDQTSEILKKYNSFPNFVMLYNDKNLGVLKSLSKLLKIAKGRYIALLDADDYWQSNNHLQRHFNIYKEKKNIGFIFGNYLLIEENTGKSRQGIDNNFKFPDKNQFELSIINYPILTSTSSFKKELVKEEEVREYILNEFPTSDYGIYLGLMLKSKGYFSSEQSTVYNFRPNSQSRKENIYDRINHMIKRHKIGDYFIAKHPINHELKERRDFLFNLKILLASWSSYDISFIKKKSQNLSLTEFLKFNPKATYIYIASKNKYLYKIFRPWVLRKRAPGK